MEDFTDCADRIYTHFILSSGMSYPPSEMVVNDFGEVLVVDDKGRELVMGPHILLWATQEKIDAYFGQFAEVWIGEGSPQFQRFHLVNFQEG